MLTDGLDPIEERRKKKKKIAEDLATRVTVDQVFAEYVEKYSKVYKKPSILIKAYGLNKPIYAELCSKGISGISQ